MNKNIRYLITLSLFFCRELHAAPNMQEDSLNAVVIIVKDNGSSSGFIAEHNGEKHIYTALGSLEYTSLMRFRTLNGTELQPTRLQASPYQDIARIGFTDSKEWPVSFLFSTKAAQIGDNVSVVGSISGDYVASRYNAKITGIGPSLFSFSGPAKEGNRGAPILDSQGAVIGLLAYYGMDSQGLIASAGHSAIRADEINNLQWVPVSPHNLTTQTRLLYDLRIVHQHLLEILPMMKTVKSTTQERVYSQIFEKRSKEWTEIGYKEANRSLFFDPKWYELLKSLCDSQDHVIEMRYLKGAALRSHSTKLIMRDFMTSLDRLENEPRRLLKETKWVLPFYSSQADTLDQSWNSIGGMIQDVRKHFQGNWD